MCSQNTRLSLTTILLVHWLKQVPKLNHTEKVINYTLNKQKSKYNNRQQSISNISYIRTESYNYNN